MEKEKRNTIYSHLLRKCQILVQISKAQSTLFKYLLSNIFCLFHCHVQLQMAHNENKIMKFEKLHFHTLADLIPLRKAQALYLFLSTHSHEKALAENANQHVLINKLELHNKHCCSSSQYNAEYNSCNPKWPQTPQVTI